MTLPAWPDVPYAPMIDSFQPVKRQLDPIRTEMEGGNLRQRARPGDNVGTVGQTIVMSFPEFETFTAWVKDLGNGTARFTVMVWLGSAYLEKVCQFTTLPTSAYHTPDTVAVAMVLRVYDV